MKISKLRGIIAALCVVLLTIVGLLFNTGTGTGCSFGADVIAAICPVGALETLLGAKDINAHWILCAAITLIVVLCVGKAFCSWCCPIPWLQRFFAGKGKGADRAHRNGRSTELNETEASSSLPNTSVAEPSTNDTPPAGAIDAAELDADIAQSIRSHKGCALSALGGKRDGLQIDSRHLVLLGTLASATLFGFPVFCLICPVGLSFATLIGIWNLLQFNETSWGMIIFPAILLIEVLFLRKWCFKFCPISALTSLIAKANFLWRPAIDKKRCMREKGVDCKVCVDVCPQQVDPHSTSVPECTKCHICAEVCPEKAISFPVYRKRRNKNS